MPKPLDPQFVAGALYALGELLQVQDLAELRAYSAQVIEHLRGGLQAGSTPPATPQRSTVEAPFRVVYPGTDVPLLTVETTPEGYPVLQIHGPENEPWVRLGASSYSGHDYPALEIRSPDYGTLAVNLGCRDRDGHGCLELNLGDGRSALYLSTHPDCSALVIEDPGSEKPAVELFRRGSEGRVLVSKHDDGCTQTATLAAGSDR